MWDPNIVKLGFEYVRGMQEDWRREAAAYQEQSAPTAARPARPDRILLLIAESLIATGTWLKAQGAPVQANH